MRNRLTFLVLVSLVSISVRAQYRPLRFERISIEQGLSQSSVLSISQDHRGFIWFGTYEGLNRYDGYQFKVYTHNALDTNSLSQNVVKFILVDHTGTLWVATEGGLNRYDWEKDIFYHYFHYPDDSSSLAHNRIRHIYEDRKGTLWISTDNGLSQYIKEKDHFINYLHDSTDPYSLSNSRVRCVYEDSRGHLWVGTDDGLNLFDAETHQFIHFRNDVNDPYSLSEDLVVCVNEDRQGLWIGTWGGGLCRYDYSSGKFFRYQNRPNDPSSLGHNIIRAIYNDTEGNLWIGTYGGGLSLFDRDHNRFIQYRYAPNDFTSISSDAMFTIFEDQSGILWIGTEFGGVSRFDKRKAQFHAFFTAAGSDSDIKSNIINTIYIDSQSHDEVIWLGTWGGGVIRFDRNTLKYHVYQHDSEDPYSLGSDIIRCIGQGGQRYIWIGTELGLSRYDRITDRFNNYVFQTPNELDMKYDNVFTLLEDHNHQLWVGSYYGGLHRFDQKTHTFFRYPVKQDDPSTINDYIVWCIFEDSRHFLWIGTETGGLNRYDPETKQFKVYQKDIDDPVSISGNKVICIYEDHSGILWIGTTSGLNRFDRKTEKFHLYNEQNGLPHQAIQGIIQDNFGYLWITTTRGISRFDPTTETFLNFSMSDGLPSNEFSVNSGSQDKNGELYFGTINGMIVFNPQEIHTNQYIPLVAITDFKIFNESIPIGEWRKNRIILEKSIAATEKIEIMYHENVISFDFAALDFAAPEKNEYAYIMEGMESEWNYVGNRHFATYNRLPHGEYVFRVKGSNNNKVWNETGTSIRIVVKPAFWSTTWFRLLSALIVLGLIFTLHRLRIYAVQRRNLQLEQMNKKLNDEIKERELAEAKVQTSLKEKEVLLKEIHHRVKNNMQIICSLLNLQSNRIQDSELKSLFVESQNRVRAMALIHESLYKTKDLHSIDFQWYLNDLAKDLLTSYTGTTDYINLDMDIDQIKLPVNQAVPCGLAINELVSNAIKYAFPEERSEGNKIHIKMTRENGEILLLVEDNGIGMDEKKQFENDETLGLKLVEILVHQQLRGEFSWEVDRGTRFYIRFQEKQLDVGIDDSTSQGA